MKIIYVFSTAFTFMFTILTAHAGLNPVCEDFFQDSLHSRDTILKVVEMSLRKSGEKILLLRQQPDFKISTKKNFSDLKTTGDCASQEVILKALANSPATQGFQIKAEEKCTETAELVAQSSTNKKSKWILDPIDGTTNYAHGMPHFSISLALAVQGQLCFGAVYAPVYNEFFYAFKGHGAFLKHSIEQTPTTIHVSKTDKLDSALWITGTEGGQDSKAIEKNTNTFAIALKLLPYTQDMRRTGSAALDLASVASGRIDGYFELSEGLNWWDIAAGLVLVEEAGGKIYPSIENRSEKNPFENPIVYVLATNGKSQIHDKLEKLVIQTTGIK
jgi:myo-inositol-1(or 4)-monophosphatase